MKRGDVTALPSEVGAARRRIDEWRETRRKGAPMPEALWDSALVLARRHGLFPVARALRVDYGALKTRMGRVGQGDAARDSGFVELEAARIIGATEPAGQTVVELWGADGSRMTVTIPGREAVDVRGLAEAFWRRGA